MSARLSRLILALLLIPALLAAGFLAANSTNGSIEIGGQTRRYLVHVPRSYDPAQPAALVLTFHGYAGWPLQQEQVSLWNRLADEEGFIAVYPAGTDFPKRWVTWAGPATDADPAQDVAFIAALIDRMEGEYNIDPARIYVNGLSNGGGMAWWLSCRLGDRIAAFGTVAGAYLTPWSACQSTRPVPAIVFHGTADPVVPYDGGPSDMFNRPFPVIADWVAELARRNGCDAPPLALPPQGDASAVQYPGCDQDAEVIFYTIEGGGHSWPGGGWLPRFMVGHTSQDVDATRLMWEFFSRHPLAAD